MAQTDVSQLDPKAPAQDLERAVTRALIGTAVKDVPVRVADLGGRRDSYSLDALIVGPDELTPDLWAKAGATGLILRFGLRRGIFRPNLRIMATVTAQDGVVTSVDRFRTFAK